MTTKERLMAIVRAVCGREGCGEVISERATSHSEHPEIKGPFLCVPHCPQSAWKKIEGEWVLKSDAKKRAAKTNSAVEKRTVV